MRTETLMVATILLAAPALAEQAHPLPTRHAFKLDATTGCYSYTGTAGEFVGRFKAGSYVRIVMDEGRIPAIDAPEFKTGAPGFWYGPLPKSGTYSVTFTPAMMIGSEGTVEVCGRTAPPETDPGVSDKAEVCGFVLRDVVLQSGEGADASPLESRMEGGIRHYANLHESPFDVFAVCTPANPIDQPRTVKLPRNTKDCYYAGGWLECTHLTEGVSVPSD